MLNKGSDTQSGSTSNGFIDRLQLLALGSLRPLVIVLGVASLLFFVLWLVTILVWPASDAQRKRVEITLANNRVVGVDYPIRFLADNQALPIYLTADSAQPFTVTLLLPDTLPLLLESVEPSTAVDIGASAGERIIVTWPFTSVVQSPGSSVVSTSTTLAQAGVPFVGNPRTVTLSFRNARTERGWLPFGGFSVASFQVVGAERHGYRFVAIETTDRANLRVFAEKYPFLIIFPTLLTVFGFLGKAYTDRQKSQREEAKKALDAFKQAMSDAVRDRVYESWKTLERLSKYLSSSDLEDLKRARQLKDCSTGELAPEVEATAFSAWADAWAGALFLQWKAANKDKLGIYRYVRVFPKDDLSAPMEKRFREFVVELNLPDPQQHEWPMRAESPKDYPPEPPKNLTEVNLFPDNSADSDVESRYLFSNKQWFWHEHPLYRNISTYTRPMLVCGENGCGRTALALALTRYAEIDDRVLGSYHFRSAALTEVQQSLAEELLRFVRWRSTWLTKLTREDRDLLSALWLSVLDPRRVSSELSSPEPRQFNERDEHRQIWEEQAQVEFRALCQSIERMQGKPPLSASQWFQALGRCVQKMGFVRVRIALDMTAEQYEQWRHVHWWQFQLALPTGLDFPTQLIMLAPGKGEDLEARKSGIAVRQLRWGGDPGGEALLVRMLHHRAVQRNAGIDDKTIDEYMPMGIQRVLCQRANYNPRHLAELWQRIAKQNPDASSITDEMIRTATAEAI